MGLVKDWAITQELEKIAKQEALLDLPEGMASTIQLIEEMRAHIEDLQARIQKGNSWRSKLKDYLIGGFIGALIGLVFSSLIK